VDRLLTIQDLSVEFSLDRETVRAVDGIGYSVRHQEILGVAGESGCGKTTCSLALLGLLGFRWARVRGRLFFHDEGLTIDLGFPRSAERALQQVRGRRVALLPQESMTALDPLFRIADQFAEGPTDSGARIRGRDRRAHAVRFLEAVGMPQPEWVADAFPHQLSGGMRQRVLVAMAISGRPGLLLADEPTTGLDVVVQDELVRLLVDITRGSKASVQWISHSLPILGRVADRILVMYAGRIAEIGPTASVLGAPLHPYTSGLLQALPKFDRPRERLRPIGGAVPPTATRIRGCAFWPRCSTAEARCREEVPPFEPTSGDRLVACWRPKTSLRTTEAGP
jgi:oligopeptide/dipeptide ABC transporter ATP-binding protein